MQPSTQTIPRIFPQGTHNDNDNDENAIKPYFQDLHWYGNQIQPAQSQQQPSSHQPAEATCKKRIAIKLTDPNSGKDLTSEILKKDKTVQKQNSMKYSPKKQKPITTKNVRRNQESVKFHFPRNHSPPDAENANSDFVARANRFQGNFFLVGFLSPFFLMSSSKFQKRIISRYSRIPLT